MAGMRQQFRSLGTLLIDKGLLTPDQLASALDDQKRSGQKLGRILVARGWVREKDILAVLNGMMVVVFQIEGEDFGVETLLVREIVRYPGVRPLPGAPAWLEGIMDYRGAALPVVDMRARLGRPTAARDASTRVIVHEGRGGRDWGLAVDSVSAVVQIANENLEPAPGGWQMRGVQARWLTGMARLETRSVAVLNVEVLLGSGEEESAPALRQGSA